MTVKELKEALEGIDESRIVIMSSDGEGNSYSPLSDISDGAYEAESTWSGTMGLEKLTKELKEEGYSEEDVIDGEPAICLWPTN